MAFVSPGLQVSMAVIFMGMRILHTFFYAAGAQPWRTVAYALSVSASRLHSRASLLESSDGTGSA